MLLALKDSELRYRRLFEAAQDGILILDAGTGMIEDINPYLIKMLGYSREECIKKKLWEVGAFKDIQASQIAFEALQENEYIRYEDLPLRAKDGRLVQVEFVSNVYLVDDEKVIQCNIRDITHRKEAERAALKSEERYHTTLDTMMEGCQIIDYDWRYIYVNDVAAKQGRSTPVALLMHTVMEVYPGIESTQLFHTMRLSMEKRIPQRTETQLFFGDGTFGWFELSIQPVPQGIFMLSMDISERKEADEALQLSEEKYRALVNEVNDGFYVTDSAGVFTFANLALAQLYGFERPESLVGRKFSDFVAPEMPSNVGEAYRGAMQTGSVPEVINGQIERPDGTHAFIEIKPVFILKEGQITGSRGIVRDVTERKRAEEALHQSDKRFRALIENSADAITLLDINGIVTYDSPAAPGMLGYAAEDWIGKNVFALVHPEDLTKSQALFQNLIETPGARLNSTFRVRHKSGAWLWLEIVTTNLLAEPAVKAMVLNYRDVTERMQADERLRESNERFRGVWETTSDALALSDADGIVLTANPAYFHLYGYTAQQVIGNSFAIIFPEENRASAIEQYKLVFASDAILPTFESAITRADGSERIVETHVTFLNAFGQHTAMLSNIRDITERKRAEEALQASEAKFRSYIEHAPLGVFIADRLGRYVEVNAAAAEMLGHTESELLHLSVQDVLAPQSLKTGLRHFQKVVQDGFATTELLFHRKDGVQFWVGINAVKLSEDRFMAYCQDITERKMADDDIHNAREFLQSVQNAISEHIAILDDEGNIVQVNSAWRDFGAQNGLRLSNHCIGMNYLDVCDSAKGLYSDEAALVANAIRKVRAGEKDEIQIEYPCHAADAQRWFIVRITSFENNKQKWIVVAHQNITERKQTEVDIRQRLSELEVLYQSGFAFSQPVNPKAIAEKMIGLLEQEMDWHHTAIRLYHPESETLELLAFNLPKLNSEAERSTAEERFKILQQQPGQGLSGWVIQHGEVVRSNDLKNDRRYFETFPGLKSGLYVPIKLGERVLGVITIESEQADAFSESDERLTMTLATQAAIAIDNAQLFERLKLLNIDLAAAYDATIEGWSRALDLRDKETEGHSQRVTEMTLRLANTMGLSQEELVHVRRGALLHDIGKMGIPDGILLKPGPLTDEEWVKMKKHPIFAYEMLAPIRYLRLALDIPYCHHEKWDGSGYPRGLKGEEIPLAARIFAVLDVWDALSSDRSYRPAWAKEKVREHIRSLSGAHFDPQVVDVFMQMHNSI